MTVARRPLRTRVWVAVCLSALLFPCLVQKTAAFATPENTRQVLVNNARALESRGRPDMAIQVWQQVLLSDPKNIDALAGMARDLKLTGSPKADAALERLRAVSPDDPNIPRIQALSSTRTQNDRLRQAGDLARQGRNEEAMRIYRDIYGDHPPDGDIAMAYYQTLYGTANGKAAAVEAMRALAQRNPGDSRYAIELGTMLTYDPRTRAEGIRLLEAHSKDANAQAPLRQALIWDSANPASAAELRQYIKEHPQDSEIAAHLKENEGRLALMNSGIARTPAERAAFAALNAKRLDEAQTRFTELLERDPNNGRVAAGMGFLRMQQNNFAGAISYLTQAQQDGYKSQAVQNALAASRFWYTMSEASQAFAENQFELAAAKYKEALVMRPRSVEALNGLAGLLVKQQQFGEAAVVYEQLLKIDPRNADAWRGVFLAYAQDGQNQKALAIAAKFPPGVKAAEAKDPEYLRTLATIYHTEHRDADAQRVLAQALALPFPANGANLKADTRLQYAGILMEAHRFDQAAAMYAQIVNDDNGIVAAWMGLVSAHHELAQDNAAIGDVQKMPPATYESALSDVGFLTLLGSIYQQANQFDIAQTLFERAVKMQTASGGQPTMQLELQLAAVYLQRGNSDHAYALYRQVLLAHPDRADAWKGLIAAMQATHHDTEALAEIALIPAPVGKQLESDFDFVQGEASLYAATGDTAHATEYMNRVQAHYAKLRTAAPANIEIQNAWLLYNTRNDRALYPVLMRLGARQDLTPVQRETVQTIWANWSVRRAGTAIDNGDNERAVEILEAAGLAFPDNVTVRKVLAGGYLRTGHAKQALNIYKSLPMQDSTAAEFQGAIGAALAANDKTQAEQWLRQALERFPKDAAILGMAARFEQARGDNQRAADYWRASIAAMPQPSPTDRLAHDLAYPDTDLKPHKAATAADLQRLLDPENEPFPKTNKLPPLPAYGPDPYNGIAPVVLGRLQANPHSTGPNAYSGKVVLPPSEEHISSTDSDATVEPSTTPVWKPSPPAKSSPTIYIPETLGPVSRIPQPSEPLDQRAAEAQTLFADQTDAQLTQGSAAQIRTLANAQGGLTTRPLTTQTNGATYNTAQYTPSAQEAATGAYSAPKPQNAPSKQQKNAPKQPNTTPKQQDSTQLTGQSASGTAQKPAATTKPARKKPSPPAKKDRPVPTLATAPAEPAGQQAPVAESPTAEPQTTPSTGATDQELEQHNLPPLRGPWIRIQRQANPINPREEAEMQLRSLESGYSGWVGGTGLVNYRSGSLGYDHLAALEAPFEVSTPLGYHARFTFVAKPVFLDSGQADGSSLLTVQEASTAGTTLLTIPQPLGTDTNTAPSATTSPTSTPPGQQNAAGVGGEVQLAFSDLSLAAGYTPFGFLVSNATGRAQWRPAHGPFTFNFVRDSVKDTQLSYAGLRDPGTASLSYPGTIWGGVVANQGNAQFSLGDEQSGFYIGVGGQYITGYNVENNNRIDGTGGAYWRVKTVPEFGNLSIGANFFGMHYQNNQQAFTFGMGGYFSPQAYFLANIPVTWTGHYLTKWHYEVLGGLGVQAFQTDATPLFPLAAQKASEVALNNAMLPAKTSVGPNYNLRGNASYQIGPHWFAGGFVTANNSRNYEAVSAGFSIHYMFRSQPSAVAGPTGLFPTEGLRPFTVP